MARYAALLLAIAGVVFVWKRTPDDDEAPAIRQSKAATPLPAEELTALISTGEEVEVHDHLAEKGRYTVVEFTAEWCPACKSLAPRLEQQVKRRGTVRLRTIDIDRWDSPVAYQYGIRKLPTLLLYDGSELVSENRTEILNFVFRED